jgi:hypothetical protein
MSNTALATTSAAPQEIQQQEGGLGLDGTSAIRPVPMTLKQPTTEGLEDVKVGQFADKLSGVVWNQVRLVPLSIKRIRDKYPSAKFVKGEHPICRSMDGVLPVLNNKDLIPQAPTCKVCSHSSWDGYDYKTKTGDKPTCKESILIVFIEIETQLPFYIKIVGMSVKDAKRLKEAIERNAQISAARNKDKKKPNLFDYVVDMTAVKGDGPYYDVKFPRVSLMKPEDAAQFGPMYEAIVLRSQQAQQEGVLDDQVADALGVEDDVQTI